MPRAEPAEYESLSLRGRSIVRDHSLHDVWLIDLDGETDVTIPELRALITRDRLRSLPASVRGLFRLRSFLGRVFRLDEPSPAGRSARSLVRSVPSHLAADSLVPPGSSVGPFTTLYVLPAEAAYQALNATVDAVVVVVVIPSPRGARLLWATHLAAVGRITSLYMHLIDPFRRRVVYPGLERWLLRSWGERGRTPRAGP